DRGEKRGQADPEGRGVFGVRPISGELDHGPGVWAHHTRCHVMNGQQRFDPTWGIPAPRGRGQPALDDAEKARRGTLKASRAKARTHPEQAIVMPARAYAPIADTYAADVLA